MEIEVDGLRAYAYTGGKPFNPTLPVVLFIHGAQHDHSVWILQTRHLAHHGYSVLAIDLPAHGRSAGPALDSVAALAAWVLRLLDALGVSRAVLVGHSLGSLIALEAAGQAPERAAALVLVGTAFPMRVSEALLEAARKDESAAFAMINQWSHARSVHRPGTPGPGFSVLNQNLRLMQRQRPGLLHTDFQACNAYDQGLARTQSVRCPVLFILGERDFMTPPKSAAALIEALPQARVVKIAGCGHALQTEAPDAVREALDGFLRAH